MRSAISRRADEAQNIQDAMWGSRKRMVEQFVDGVNVPEIAEVPRVVKQIFKMRRETFRMACRGAGISKNTAPPSAHARRASNGSQP